MLWLIYSLDDCDYEIYTCLYFSHEIYWLYYWKRRKRSKKRKDESDKAEWVVTCKEALLERRREDEHEKR